MCKGAKHKIKNTKDKKIKTFYCIIVKMLEQVIECPETRQEFKHFIQQHTEYSILIKAYASWCRPCDTIKEYVYNQFHNLQKDEKILILLNVDEQPDVASSLKIRALPTLLTYKDGMKDNVVEGTSKEEISHLIRKMK